MKAELQRRIREDPDYRASIEHAEAERAKRTRRNRQAEQPILRDLAAAGVVIDSVWSLHKHPASMPKAIPVLLDHIGRSYPDSVLNAVGTALSDKSSRPWWAELKALYLATETEIVRDRLAAALSHCATRVHYDDLLSFLRLECLGESRIYFMRPVNRIGNRILPGAGKEIIGSVADDSTLGKEARAILAGRGSND